MTLTMKRFIQCTLITSLVIIALLMGAGYYMLNYALRPEGLETRSRDIPGSYTYIYKEYPELKPWVDSLRTADALRDTFLTGEGEERGALERRVREAGMSERVRLTGRLPREQVLRLMFVFSEISLMVKPLSERAQTADLASSS